MQIYACIAFWASWPASVLTSYKDKATQPVAGIIDFTLARQDDRIKGRGEKSWGPHKKDRGFSHAGPRR